ncbi:rho guanine nucleotide exchange factor 25 isoform X3 [Rhineura floridana]|uniref:rho guanine nucleotide exchange factor 25 isoform X3 n=1 Tax=Rhineura floridana TaxID=261503 RepID=UPI002AC875C9|nr:rho guanine nucleotide exchange factor 25 isoform X3 [Rhineura floridana]
MPPALKPRAVGEGLCWPQIKGVCLSHAWLGSSLSPRHLWSFSAFSAAIGMFSLLQTKLRSAALGLPDLCSQEEGAEMQPQASSNVERSFQDNSEQHHVEAQHGAPEAQATEEDPYSVAGSDGSISASVASIQPQASSSSAPSSPASRHSVSTLKKWLTNPVRKLSAGGLPRGERPLRKPEGRTRRHGRQEDRKSIDLGQLGQAERPFAVPQDSIGMDSNTHLPDLSLLSSLREGNGSGRRTQGPDSFLIPRDPQSPEPLLEPPVPPPASEEQEEEERRSALEKSMFVLRELIETEKMYVEDLGQIVEGYLATMNVRGIPEGMKGKDKIIFGNIHQIYDWHKDYLLRQLERCLENPDLLAELFIKHERRLHMYVVYCQNKPKSEHIVSEFIDTYFEELKQELGHRLQLNDLLIKPVQRIMKYQLLLKDFLKYYGKAGKDTEQLERAVEVMCFVPKRCNDMMNVGRLQGFEGKLTAQGKLLQQDTFWVTEQAGGILARGRERRVFLFEQIVILSETLERRRGPYAAPTYAFKSSIKVSCLGLEPCVDNDPCKFALISRGAERGTIRYVLQAATSEIAQAWVADISLILETQRDFLNALQSPIEYQRRESKTHSLGRTGVSHHSLPGGPSRPSSSVSMDQNKGSSLQPHNASLPSLYLPGPAQPEHQPYVEPSRSQSSPGPGPVHIPSDGFEMQLSSSPEQEPLHMALSDEDARPLLPDPEVPEISFPQGCAQLAKLDEDEL